MPTVVATGVLLSLLAEADRAVAEFIAAEKSRDPQSAGAWREDLSAFRRGEVIFVVGMAWADVEHEGHRSRWQQHVAGPFTVRRQRSTRSLLHAAAATEDGNMAAILSDAGHAGWNLTRWQIAAAPRHIELDPALEALVDLD
jgi:hypothetical protein